MVFIRLVFINDFFKRIAIEFANYLGKECYIGHVFPPVVFYKGKIRPVKLFLAGLFLAHTGMFWTDVMYFRRGQKLIVKIMV